MQKEPGAEDQRYVVGEPGLTLTNSLKETRRTLADYDWNDIRTRREEGEEWPPIASDYGVTPGTIRKAYSRHRGRAQDAPATTSPSSVEQEPGPVRKDGMQILGIDIETAPHTAYVWGTRKQYINTDQMVESGRVMCFSSRWFSDGEDAETLFVSERGSGHRTMIRAAWALLDQADAVVHYNGSKFDIPMLNREFIKYDMTPPSTFREVDLLKTARKRFKFNTNKLDNVLHELGIGRKVEHTGFRLWVDCMAGDEEAWELMEKYNRGDVDQMQTLYERMLPWISRHPNHALYKATLDRPTCPNCGGTDLNARGYRTTKTQRYRRYCCTDCGTWTRERYTDVSENERQNIMTQA